MIQEGIQDEIRAGAVPELQMGEKGGTRSPAQRQQTILIVDDAELNRSLLRDMLGESYLYIEACDGLEAMAALKEHLDEISVVLLDVVMPEMDGLEVLSKMAANGWLDGLSVIMITSDTSSETVKKAYMLGAADFIGRPFDVSIVSKRVTNALALQMRQDTLADLVQEEVARRERSVASMVSILGQVVEFKAGDGEGHVENVALLTELLLRRLAKKNPRWESELTQERIETIRTASTLHDIGKISIADEILNKPGRLTKEEFETMKSHTAIGAEILSRIPGAQDDPLIGTACEICRWHHERYDGQGYPDGLAGDDIPISAQVVSIADVYDALTSKRVYKDAYSHEDAMDMIARGSAGQFNPLLIECLEEGAEDVRALLGKDGEGKQVPLMSDLVDRALKNGRGQSTSDKTLELLDYERKKYDFYAQMSNELQFDYTPDPPTAVIKDYGQRKLGIPEIVEDPLNDDLLISMFGEDGLDQLAGLVKKSSPESPVVQCDLLGTFEGGDPRWFHLDARSMWAERKDGHELVGVIGKLVDVHESRERLADLEKKATHDSLTDLVNHDFTKKMVTSQMAQHPDDTFVVMVMDMDHFKQANDTLGHQFGDAVLRHFADKLRSSVRDDDIICRMGGDEFVVCLRGESLSRELVERIYSKLGGKYEDFDISVSMGVASAKGSESDYETLFRLADEALYHRKKNGRGGVTYRSDVEGEIDTSAVIER